MVKLNEVFGISTKIPKFTYVDRQMLDKKFAHYLSSEKHIVIYGASKQGKSCLRKKNINESSCVVVQCNPSMETAEYLWKEALEKMEKQIQTGTKSAREEGDSDSMQLQGNAKAVIVESQLGAETSSHKKTTKESEHKSILSESSLGFLAKCLRSTEQRLVLEDFHYLPEQVRKDTVFGIKTLYEEGVYVIIIGIWSEQNLITYYNGDLSGRIEELNLSWEEHDLDQVLSKGEGTLNIRFAPGFRKQLIESAFQNVGLLQRLAEKTCYEAGILEAQEEEFVISDISILEKARTEIVSDARQRYSRIAEVFKEGMKAGSLLHLYGRVYNELIEATDKELVEGIPTKDLLNRIQEHSDQEIRPSDLTQALDRIERLQANKSVTPLLVSYSKSVRKLFLNDREFLFYRKYSGDDIEELKVHF